MTFSLTARCPRTGAFGIAACSSSPAVAARCIYARAGDGAVATQNITDPRLGPTGLDLLHSGLPARETMARLVRVAAPHAEFRQLALVDRRGETASFSGTRTLGRHGVVERDGAVAAGNLLADADVPARMVEAFSRATSLDLGDRILGAMRAAVLAGGEEGPVHSAGLLLVRDGVAWPVADLRVDWDEGDPIETLARLWERWKPDMDAYVTRALNPLSAPAYGVPGDH